jgi:predicted O-methyltransferase YrrM
MKVHGFDRVEMLKYLKEKYFNSDNIKIAEIGVLYGDYSLSIRDVFKNSELYLIDLWQTQGNDFYYSARDGVADQAYDKVKIRFENDKQSFLLKGKSEDMAKKFEDNSFDLVYIDADHSYEGVKNDINTWVKKVKKGGIIAGHDWDPDPNMAEASQFGINKALTEYLNQDLTELNITNEHCFKSWFLQKT